MENITHTEDQRPKLIWITIALLIITSFGSYFVHFTLENSHFFLDDFDHFYDAAQKSLADVVTMPIDVHFVPLHKLSSYVLFNLDPLNYPLAVFFIMVGWACSVAILYLNLKALTSKNKAIWITVFFACSPVWFYIFIWWSAAVHRIPYTLFLGLASLFYLKFRNTNKAYQGLLVIVFSFMALGFYIKAILFPIYFFMLEAILFLKHKKLSKSSIYLCLALSSLIAAYLGWFFFMAPTQESPPIDILKTLEIALIWTARYGAALLCLPFEQNWATSVAACFWSGLFAYSIWKKPITAIPILGLVSYVFLESALIASSRGIFIELNPLTSARYFAEDLFFTAIFVGLILSLHGTTTNHATKYRFMVVIPIIYAFYAGALAHSSQAKAFMRHKESNIYFSNIEREYSERAKHPPIKLLHHLLPESVYSFFGQRRSTKGIFEVAYPSYHWTNDIEGEDTYYVFDDEGRLDALTLPDHFSFKDNLHFIGWSFAEVNHRWSLGKSSKLAFSTQPNKSYVGTIRIHGPVYGEQLVESRLNGNLIDIRTITPQEDCCTWELSFAPNHLKEKGLNLLEFSTPNARTPGGGDPRVLSIGLTEIKIN